MIKLIVKAALLTGLLLAAAGLPARSAGSLVTPQPSAEARKVYDFLKENWGRKIITGAMARVNWNIDEAEKIHRATGRYPALACFDYLHLPDSQPGGWIDYTNTKVVERWWKKRGLVACMWHWKVPAADGSSRAFYAPDEKKPASEYTTFDAEKALQPGTAEHRIIEADLNQMAHCLMLLKDRHIPVIWRPLHEAAGRWFWWGARGPETYKRLWRYMFDYFQARGLNNLIWVWTSENGDSEWYPGDRYVDIIGRDIYTRDDAAGMAREFAELQKLYPGKIIALTECGGVAPLSQQWAAGARWSWFMPWYDYDHADLKDDSSADSRWWKDALARDYVITRDMMPRLK